MLYAYLSILRVSAIKKMTLHVYRQRSYDRISPNRVHLPGKAIFFSSICNTICSIITSQSLMEKTNKQTKNHSLEQQRRTVLSVCILGLICTRGTSAYPHTQSILQAVAACSSSPGVSQPWKLSSRAVSLLAAACLVCSKHW